MVDRVRKGKINAEGGQECGLGNSISSRRQMFRFAPFFSSFFFSPSSFSNRQETITDGKRVKCWWRDRERRRRWADISVSSARTDRISRWICRLKRRRQLRPPIVNRFDRYWNGGNGSRNGYFSPLLSRISTEKRDARDSSLPVKSWRSRRYIDWT